MKKHTYFAALVALVLAPFPAGQAAPKCVTDKACRNAFAVANEFVATFSGDIDRNAEAIGGVLFNLGIQVLDVDEPTDTALLRAAPGNPILGPDADLDVARDRLNRELAPRRLNPITLIEANHVVLGSTSVPCGTTPPAPDAARLRVELAGVASGGNDRLIPVAVIDSGTEVTHPGLGGRLWTNGSQSPTGGNYYGASFNSGGPHALQTPATTHGTQVAGVIAGNYQTGPQGMSTLARIMTVQFLWGAGNGSTYDAARAVDYAVEKGAQIVNMSWSAPCTDKHLKDALIRAANGGQRLLVAAAGNHSTAYSSDNDKCPLYPASYAKVDKRIGEVMIVVSAVQPATGCEWLNTRNGKTTVHVSAPGVDVETLGGGGECATFDGTSAATPFVSGIAALTASRTQGWSWPQRRTYLLDAAKKPNCTLMSTTGAVVNAQRATASPATVTKPAAGDTARSGVPLEIAWNNEFKSAVCTFVDVLFSRDGVVFATRKKGVLIAGGHTQIDLLPGDTSTQARIRLVCSGTALASDSPSFVVQ